MRKRLRLQYAYLLEAALVGVFFVQALRFLIGTLYSHIASAGIVINIDPASVPAGTGGVVDPAAVTNEVTFVLIMIGLPLLTLLFGRWRWWLVVGAALVAIGRALMFGQTSLTPTLAAALAVGGGLLYISSLIRHRAQTLPYLLILGLGADQLFRALGNTLDITWSPTAPAIVIQGMPIVITYFQIIISFSVVLVLISVITFVLQRRQLRGQSGVTADNGLLPLWGALGLGALLFLELSLLALPNAVAGRAGVDYTTYAPFIMAATLLPLVPWIRRQARAFIALFDGGVRGWSWMLVVMLLMVIGTRVTGVIGGVALVLAQFAVSMLWWWVVRPQAEKERSFTGLWMIAGVLIFALLVVADSFTYEYAYVQSVALGIPRLDELVPSLLRGFRGMGLGVLLLGVFLAALPMIQTQRRIPWTSGTRGQSLIALIVVVLGSVGAALATQPPLIQGVRGTDNLRIGTYNIHSGFSEFYQYDLEAIARTIQQSGAEIVLLQEVEAGRLSSFGVDQSLWLARRVGMDVRYYPTNEGLQGLAVMSQVEIVFDDGELLTSVGNQTGIQRVQVRPDEGVITIYNTWLGLLIESTGERPLTEQEQDQQQQLDEIFGIISSHHPNGQLGRTVIGGTFNNIPDSPLVERLENAGFIDPFAGQPLEPSATLVRLGLRARLDYVWIVNLARVAAGVMDSNSSDHRLAVIDVLITRRSDG